MISFKLLDHGSLSLVDKWGSDESIIEAARMSTAKGFLGWGTTEKPGDEKLLQYLYEHKHCYDEQTEVLTSRGFVSWPEVGQDDVLGQWDPEANSLVYERPLKLVRRQHSGRMYKVDHGGVDLLVTENHRMFVKQIVSVPGENRQEWSTQWQLVSADVLDQRSMIRYRKHAPRNLQNPINLSSGERCVIFPEHDDSRALLRLIGFFIGDGYAGGTQTNGVTFHLHKPRKVAFLREVCAEVGWELFDLKNDTYVVCADGLGRFFRAQFYDTNGEKHIPSYLLDLSKDDADAVLEGLRNSDGSIKCGAWEYYSTSKQVADAVQLLVLHAGGSAHITCNDGYMYRVMVLSRMLEPVINQGKKNTHWEENFSGEVFCAHTRTGILIVRRNGKIVLSGNSTPFEMGGMTIEVQAPIFVFREWHRHRTQCLAGSTKLFFDPSGHGPFTIKHIFKKFGPDIAELRLRCVNERTLKSEYTSIVNVWESGEKDVFDVEAKGAGTIRCSSDHRFFTPSGWRTLKEIVSISDDKSIEINTNNAEIYISVKSSTDSKVPAELWLPVEGWEDEYQISSHGRVKKTSTNEEFSEFTSTNDGHQCISLISADEGKSELRGIHMMVLNAFESQFQNGMECVHLDKDPSNNNISNLQWKNCKKSKFKTVPQQILSVKYAGVEMTYDIEVTDPWHNFIAEGFIVHNSVNEMSARYIPLPDVNYIPSVERLLLNSKVNKQAGTVKGSEILDEHGAEQFRISLAGTYKQQQDLYEKALQMGVPKELARVHLPVGRYSRMRVSANLRNWLGFLTLRMAPDAQWEIRQYANSVAELVSLSFPRTYGLFKNGQK